mmetsp:Transcript_22369/g.42969  ORF Transcript_22369/g.42969 Transcript_22369/m.42969 type:complete len:1012 (+) Transcript_22369:77-3112(+)
MKHMTSLRSQAAWLLLLAFGGAQAAQLRRSKRVVRVPQTDHRKYEYTSFDNGLKVLAVEDTAATKAGFAVAVTAGSFYDPPELPGLAHFCEHLLFLGTKKYPDEASYDGFLSQHDGTNNAYTEQERTVFFNELSHAGFEEGLDRFAQFFISPLFKAEMVGRELEAVNSEHVKNIPDQGRRLWELMRSEARNGSVINRFYTGNTESLKHGDAETVAALKKYHSENYCAPRMHLVLVSNRPLKEQIKLAHHHFDAVPRGRCSPEGHDFAQDHPFSTSASLGRFIQLHSDSAPQLWMMFPLPPIAKLYKAQPASLVEYFLGYAGPNSLKSQLKKRDLISDLNLQVDQSSAATLVFVMFDLTAKGRHDVDEVTSTVWGYLSKLKESSKSAKNEVVRNVYQTVQQMSKVTFDYQEAPNSVMDLVSGLAASMSVYAPEDILAGDTTVDSMDSSLVVQLLGQLTPENVNLALASRDFNATRDANKYNQWYAIHFSESAIPESMQKRWSQQGSEMQVPPPLRYVPSELSVRKTGMASEHEVPKSLTLPAQGLSSPEVWWLARSRFPLPKVQLRAKLAVPSELAATPEFAALRKLHVELSNRGLEESMEDLVNCGLNFNLEDAGDGYRFSMDGYSEHMAALVAQAASGFAKPVRDAKRFEQARQKLLDTMEDTSSQMPYEHAMEVLSVMSTNSVFSRLEVMRALKALDTAKFSAYMETLQKKGVRVQLLATGNLAETKARELAVTFASKMGTTRVLGESQAAASRALQLNRDIEVRMQNPIPDDTNSVVVNAYQFGVPDIAERVKLLMLGKMISQPAYDQLRTKEQLGYVVFALVMPHLSTLELRLIVQGAKKGPDDMDHSIESMLTDFQRSLQKLSVSEFAAWKKSLRSTINKTDQNMGEEADRFWSQIASGEKCFNRKELALEFLDSLESAADVTAEFDRFRRHPRKTSIRLFGEQSPVNGTAVGRSVQLSVARKTAASAQAPSTLVLFGDGQVEKAEAASGQGYWPALSVCRVHRST